jgi:hypothetical protein
MDVAGLVLADTLKKGSPAGELSILWAALWVIGALLLGAAIIAYVKGWRQRPVSFHLSTTEQLARFRVLYERGQLSPEEFARIESRLNERLKREMNLPAAATTEPASAADRPFPPAGIPKPVELEPRVERADGQVQPPAGEPNNP